MQVYPRSAPQAPATTDLVNRLRHRVLPALERRTGVPVLVAGLTAGSIDFSQVLSRKLPLFIAVVVLLSALLLFVIFRSLVIPIQAALDEPAQHRRRDRRDRRRVPVGLARRRCSACRRDRSSRGFRC